MWEKLLRFSALDRTARGLFLRALVMLPLVALRLKLRGFQDTRAALQKSPPHAIPELRPDVVETRARLTAYMVDAADRHGWIHPSCLAKSLTLRWLLERQGIASRLCIGIRKQNGTLQAHSWVERNGVALNESDQPHQHYAAFDGAFPALPQDD